jgi:hypothetical protein
MTEPPDVLTRLRERHAELVRAMRETGFADDPPHLRDRHPFFHWLLNGARDTYDQVRPQWQEHKRNVENAARLESDIDTVIRGKVMDEPGYRALGARANEERTAMRSCHQLIQSIRAARDEITRVTTRTADEADRADVKRDEGEVSKRLDEVRRHLDHLRTLPAGSTVHPAGLRIEFSRAEGPRRRNKKYADIEASLGSLQKNVDSVLDAVSKRASKARDDQHQYMVAGIARYERPSDGRG